jgi:hypothetical protein
MSRTFIIDAKIFIVDLRTAGYIWEINDMSQLMSMEKFSNVYQNIILFFSSQLHTSHGSGQQLM